MIAIVLYGFRESLRRKMFLVVVVLTAVFLGLYGYGVDAAFKDAESFAGPGRHGSTRRRSPEPRCSGSRCSRSCFSAAFSLSF